MSDHKCFDVVDESLKPRNARLATAVRFSGANDNLSVVHLVQTEKLDSSVRSKKAPLVVMSYCPFCGTNLSDACKRDGETA